MPTPRRHVTMGCIAAALATAVGCAGSRSDASEPTAPAATAPASASAAEPATAPGAGEPTVTRSALLAALDRGPGAFLQMVEVEAHFEEGAFAGWTIVAFRGEADDAPVDLRPGDVIKSINGYGLERPEYLHAIFVELRTAEAIVVEGERAGKPFEVRVPIVDDLEE